jgi:hypothetical protein
LATQQPLSALLSLVLAELWHAASNDLRERDLHARAQGECPRPASTNRPGVTAGSSPLEGA